MKLNDQQILRRQSLEELKKIGVNPYAETKFNVDTRTDIILSEFEKTPEKFSNVKIAGRIMNIRVMGKASFADLKDHKGKIQIYLTRDNICPDEDKTVYNKIFKKYTSIGDIIGIEGSVFKTKVGEISIDVKKFKILSKCLNPIPIVKTDKDGIVHDEFSDLEIKYRQRYLDLITNDKTKEIFIKRTKIINIIREFLNENEYTEVETPILQSIPGGAMAKPFETFHNTLNIPLYLRIANELFLKRLIVGDMGGVYEFAKDFRNEGMDRSHNPEFTMLELYVPYKNYEWMMDLTEKLIKKIAKSLNLKTLKIDDKEIDLETKFERIAMSDIIKKHTNIDVLYNDEDELRKKAEEIGIDTSEIIGKAKLIDEIFSKKCETKLINPTFITNHPVEMSPLSKKNKDNPLFSDRFELIINGKEIANAYSELNDPFEQLNRFKQQLKLSKKGDKEAMLIDDDFIKSLEFGMPPTAGIGIGIDRLVMLFTSLSNIQDVILFPQMKPKNN